MYLKLDPSAQINVRPNLALWKKAAATDVTYIALTMMPNGTVLAVSAQDGQLHTLATPDSAPTHIPNSGAVRSVAVMWDGTIVGVGITGNGLWTRATLIESPWVSAPSDVPIVSVSAHPEGGLLGLSDQGALLTKGRPGDPAWRVLPSPKADLVAIAARRDGSVLGVGTDNLLYLRPDLGGTWRQLPGTAAVTSVAEMPDGSLVVLGTDGMVYTAAGAPSVWTPAAGDGGVIAAATAPDGSIVALDPEGQVVTRASAEGTWTKAPAGTPMIDVSVFPDGVLLGVNRDQSLYTRAGDFQTDWVRVPDSGAVTSATVLADGVTILGVGLDVGLWTRTRTGIGGWVKVQGSDQGVRAISVNGLRDGSILGIEEGTNSVLRRVDLQNPWESRAPGGTGVSVIEVPEQDTMVPDAHRWLLQFTSSDPADPAGDGRPWGDGTAMAARASTQRLPWDYGNRITPLVGGFAALGAVRDAFETAIAEAEAMKDPPGERGHVLIVDWLLNGLRDLSEENSWGGGPWKPTDVAKKDQTALGLILRLMSAGIVVRVLLWQPTTSQAEQLGAHADEHWSMAAAIQDHNDTLMTLWGLKEYVGVCELDLRTARPTTASLHQKMVAIRVGNLNVAFCGGVDLAFTRRDFARPADNLIGRGDWQSGDSTPVERKGWPKQSPPPYGGYPDFPYSGGDKPFPEDLPGNVYGTGPRHWHDHHLKLEGPIVTSLEQQFAERWIIPSSVYVFDRTSSWIGNDDQVQLTSALAIDRKKKKVVPLPPALPCAPVGDAAVQMWRTIPLRPHQSDPPFARGEFTVMAGVAQAVARSENLITIWDQYFWSLPLAVLLTDRLKKEPDLRLLIVLPPYGSSSSANEMWYRRRAVQFLWNNLDRSQRSRVLALNTWAAGPDIGVYVHAKVQTYDDSLLVCGSANMNRRSLSCDAELDCAVMHRPALETHLANLHLTMTRKGWTDFGPGWLLRFWQSIQANHSKTLVTDPFWQNDGGRRYTPNGVEITWDGMIPEWEFEPSSIGPVSWSGIPDIEANVCADQPANLAGRLDEVTYLIERCHDKDTWPWRKPNTST